MFFSESDTKKALAYYRHSAEDKQENSVEIQQDKIRKFAEDNAIEIIHEEADEGKSGLKANRPGFQSVINQWVKNPEAPDFDYILVLDVSRWGRFQDQDESAHYEFVCKQHGKQVIYVNRGFQKEEGKLIGHLQTSIERYMAAEYSKQLSEKVFAGSIKVSEQGYSAGGSACYGMVRIRISADKKIREVLKPGEWKVLANDRVTFAPAHDETTQVVKDIFNLFVQDRHDLDQITQYLNTKKIPTANGGLWNPQKILRILQNETYTGARVYNKTWGRLKQKKRKNKREDWVIIPDAFEAIVSEEIFIQAKEYIREMKVKRNARPISIVRNVRRSFEQELELVLRKNNFSDELIDLISHNIPVVYSVSSGNDVKSWFLELKEEHYHYEQILVLLIDAHTYDTQTHLVDQSQFNTLNHLIVTEGDPVLENNLSQESLFSYVEKLFVEG